MDLHLARKKVIVTGASKGIGLDIANEFAKEGASVSICARGRDSLESARELIAGNGGNVYADICDVSDKKNPPLKDRDIVYVKSSGLNKLSSGLRAITDPISPILNAVTLYKLLD